jgi:hypothetical protein
MCHQIAGALSEKAHLHGRMAIGTSTHFHSGKYFAKNSLLQWAIKTQTFLKMAGNNPL